MHTQTHLEIEAEKRLRNAKRRDLKRKKERDQAIITPRRLAKLALYISNARRYHSDSGNYIPILPTLQKNSTHHVRLTWI